MSHVAHYCLSLLPFISGSDEAGATLIGAFKQNCVLVTVEWPVWGMGYEGCVATVADEGPMRDIRRPIV